MQSPSAMQRSCPCGVVPELVRAVHSVFFKINGDHAGISRWTADGTGDLKEPLPANKVRVEVRSERITIVLHPGDVPAGFPQQGIIHGDDIRLVPCSMGVSMRGAHPDR